MRNPWGRHPSSSEITGAAVPEICLSDTVAFPQLSGDGPTKIQSRYAYMEVPPKDAAGTAVQEHTFGFTSAASSDSSSSLSTVVAAGNVTQQRTFTSSAASGDSTSLSTVGVAKKGTQEHNLVTGLLQTGISIKKDWSPADDAETYPALLQTEQDRVISRPRNRVKSLNQICEDGELYTAAQKPTTTTTGTANLSASTHVSSSEQSSQSHQHKQQDDDGSTGADNEPTTTGTTNLSTATHGSSSYVDGKLPKPETTDSSSEKVTTKQNPAAGSTATLNTTTGGSTLSLALYPALTGAIQTKKQTRNAHLLPPRQE